MENYLYDDDYIPGTEHILADEDRIVRTCKGVLKRDGEVVLIPQPSDSPNDPLNWRWYRKYWQFLLLLFITALTAATSNDAGAAQESMNEELGISWGAMNTAAGVLFVGIGYFTLLLSPTAFLYGRKIGYLICIFVGLVGSIWYARVQTTADSVWNQLFVGASESCAEAQVQLSLSDIFFEHQRGTVLGLYIMATSIGTYVGPLIAGYIADRMDWRWVGWWGVIISGGFLIVLIFTLEETYFDRSKYEPNPENKSTETTASSSCTDLTKVPEMAECVEEQRGKSEPKNGYWKRVAIITPATNLVGTGFKQYIKRLWLTLRVFTFPPVLYSGLQWGAQDAWLTFYMTTQDENWSDAPYNYSADGVAIMNVPTLIGALLGCFYGGIFSDWFALYMAKRNNGVREPETRLWLMMLTAIISPLGMFLFGIGTAKEWSWPVPYVGLGFVGFGFGCAGDLSMAYLMDAYPGMVLEGMVGVSVINNTISCIFTFACQPWIDSQGTLKTYIALGILDFFFIMLTLPMIYFGKRCRKYTKGMYLRFLEARDGKQLIQATTVIDEIAISTSK
ncbi:protein Hol1p [Trichomonascus vanleenenianus]|uniref:Hol1p n=1 Tax=Trichomonascus vanleenenianus TaxID=2268995 RepID=UPI003ECB5701